MARLPIPGSDDNSWGTILNDFLSTSFTGTGLLKNGVVANAQLDSSLQTAVSKASAAAPLSLVGQANGIASLDSSGKLPVAQFPAAAVSSVAGKTGAVTLVESDIANLTTDLNGKALAIHTHSQSDIAGLTTTLAGKAAASHSHAQSDVTGLTTSLSGKVDGLNGVTGLWIGTQAQYNAISTPSSSVVYIIKA